MTRRLDAIRAMLEAHDQAHVLRFWDELSTEQRQALLNQIEAINFDVLDEWIEQYVRHPQPAVLPDDLAPAPYYPNANSPERKGRYDPAAYRTTGEELIAGGKIAVFTVAGGQGTRLGWNGPKGTFPATPITGKPLFRIFAEQILAAQKRYGITIPWYIMTSPINDADTRAFFLDNNCFGLRRQDIFMFPQGVMPSLDLKTGKLLLAEKHMIAVNPDGHGGSIKALRDSGAIEDMAGRGIEHISYIQVDNPLARVVDSLFIGLHAAAPDSSAEMSSKMVPKAYPEEKVGVFCQSGGKTMVIEYSDLPETLATERDRDGRLRFIAGSIAIHLFGVSFVERLTSDIDRFALPLHRAEKKVDHVDLATGTIIAPEQPNAVKLETFVFDALPLAEKSIVYETSRIEEFAPIKNVTGVDSEETSHALQSERSAAWLEQHGVKVARSADGTVDAVIEISPLTAQEPADLATIALPESIPAGAQITL
jgi:UDP-N-acetylglucosamine/UDP-N-acetylgalactosamine diphosphorylase